MQNSFPGFIGIDLDGTLLDTDSDGRNSPKYKEAKAVILEKTGDTSNGVFEQFYKDFVSQSHGLSMRRISAVFVDLMFKHYEVSVPFEGFREYLIEKREKTYAELVRFLGNESYNSGTWLSDLPLEARNTLVLVTSTYAEALPYITFNKWLKISGRTLDDFFCDRIVFGDKVLFTGEPVFNKKPHPEPYEKAIALTKPDKIRGLVGIAFEDNQNGIVSAKKARYNYGKLFVVGIGTTMKPAQAKEAGADYFAPALCTVKLPDLLRAYNQAYET